MRQPAITKSRVAETIQFGRHTGSLLVDCEANGGVKYLYVLAVVNQATREPVLFVTVEYSDSTMEFKKLGMSPYLLCVFNEKGHDNFGNDEDWSDLPRFRKEAIDIVCETLKETVQG